MIRPPVVPQRLPLDHGGVDLGLAVQHVDPVESLPAQAAQATAQLGLLLTQDMTSERTVRAGRVTRDAGRLGNIEDDRHGEHVMPPGQLDERLARARLDIGGIGDREPAGGQPLARDEMQHLEGVAGGRLVILVVADQPAAEIRRDHLGGKEVPRGERRLAGPGDADQDH